MGGHSRSTQAVRCFVILVRRSPINVTFCNSSLPKRCLSLICHIGCLIYTYTKCYLHTFYTSLIPFGCSVMTISTPSLPYYSAIPLLSHRSHSPAPTVLANYALSSPLTSGVSRLCADGLRGDKRFSLPNFSGTTYVPALNILA